MRELKHYAAYYFAFPLWCAFVGEGFDKIESIVKLNKRKNIIKNIIKNHGNFLQLLQNVKKSKVLAIQFEFYF